MAKLFISLYLDEDVNVLLVDLLQNRGFDAISTRDAGNLSLSDEEQLLFAVQSERVLLTHNRVDFEKLLLDYFEENKTHYGIIIASRHPIQEIFDRTLTVLNQISFDEMVNQVIYI